MALRLLYDPEANIAEIQVAEGEISDTRIALERDQGDLFVDLNNRGEVIGILITQARSQLPMVVLQAAEGYAA